MAGKKVKKKTRTFLMAFLAVAMISAAIMGYDFYRKIYLPNIVLEKADNEFLYIPTGSDFTDVRNLLVGKNILKDPATFEWVAEQMNYTSQVKPGKYRISENMSNRDLITILRSGKQVPVRVVFNNIRTKKQLAGVISRQIEADSASIMGLFSNKTFLSGLGVTPENCLTLFIPDTYEFYWNTPARKFMERMAAEHDKFWNRSRKARADAIGLSVAEVTILASIVEQETRKNDEKPVIAGVYLNRYRKGWKLEADPTLIYASGDFSIRRVLNVHKEIDSPYNTYRYTGLPPGPICIPSAFTIDAVLNHTSHEYMFFCARDDFSGYHSFAKTYSDHLLHARRFQNELNRRKIKS